MVGMAKVNLTDISFSGLLFFSSIFLYFFSVTVALSENKELSSLYGQPNIYLLRHALAPGMGDPEEFNVEDCRTQRNLSEEGRRQAFRIGVRFRDNGIKNAYVVSSQWCRCLETAKLLGYGNITENKILNSFFDQLHLQDKRTTSLRGWLLNNQSDVPLILVTHQVNITALTGIYPTSGEAVVIKVVDGVSIKTLGTIVTD